MTSEALIQQRIAHGAESMLPLWQKIHYFRRVVAGDGSLSTLRGQADQNSDAFRGVDTSLHDILVREMDSGRSNYVYQAIRTLVLQTAYTFPDIDFQNLGPDMEQLHKAWAYARLGPGGCNMRDPMRLALFDALIGGSGAAFVGVDAEGLPSVEFADAFDTVYDQSARLPHGRRWCAIARRGTYEYWAEFFDGAGIKIDKKYNQDEDEIKEYWFYYDITGEGTCAIACRESEESAGEVIYVGPSLYVRRVGDKMKPYLPLEWLDFIRVPSLRMAMGLVEPAMAHQFAIWDIEDYEARVHQMPLFYAVPKGAIEKDQLDHLQEGTAGPIIESNGPIALVESAEVSQTSQLSRQEHKREITSQTGADPYASGNKVDGVKFASEVNAIQNSASLMMSSVAKENADFWARVVKKLLMVGSMYDDAPLVWHKTDQVRIEFGPDDPIREYLDPESAVIVQEDNMMFAGTERKMAQKQQLLQTTLALAQQFPGAVTQAFRDYLMAAGVRDVSAWMAQPQMMPQAPMGIEQQPGASPDGQFAA